jgi:hypothetical protein
MIGGASVCVSGKCVIGLMVCVVSGIVACVCLLQGPDPVEILTIRIEDGPAYCVGWRLRSSELVIGTCE